MLCQFDKLLYPRIADASTVDYMIAVYRPLEILHDGSGHAMSQFKAVGYCLPITEKARFRLNGHWVRHPKHGLQFEVESYEEVISHTKEGIIGYLASGQIKGVGRKIAEKIYDSFGQDTLEILDQEPEKLMTIRGISEKRLRMICDSYLATRGARDVIAFLTPHGVTANRAIKIYREYGKDTLDIIRKHPYRLVEMAGIAFKTADKLAISLGLPTVSPERVDEALMYAIAEGETEGHMCLEKHDFLRRALRLLETPEITEEMAAARAFQLVQADRLVCYDHYIYRTATATVENNIAFHIAQQMKTAAEPYENLDHAILCEERKLRITLAPEQREAVKMALSTKFCVITGGPGTGKTAVQRAILDLYQEKYPEAQIICCAPTGQAAQRMKESSGLSASTIHKALCIKANPDGTLTEGIMGVQTVLSESGNTISGGQQQRILIARAIMNKPQVLFFDEATSALDNLTQAKVCQSLDGMHVTRVVIAHRLSTIQNCDRILVFNNGQIQEEGNFESLMAQKGLFYNMAKRQIAEEN